MEESVKNEIENSLASEIVESKKQIRIQLPEVVVTLISMIIGVVFLCFNLINFWGLFLIFFGTFRNFFTDANKLFACVVSFAVCTIFALISISLNLYGMAFLHIGFYLPTQLIYFYENRKEADVSIKKNKELTKFGSVGAIVSIWIFALCVALVLYKIGEPHYIADAVCVALLSFSVFLSNGEYKEYWIARIFACFVTMSFLLYVSIETQFKINSLAFVLMFVMYVVMDIIKFIRWAKIVKTKKEKVM